MAAVDDFAQIVRRDVGGHADGDAAGAVDQQVREPRRQHLRFALGRVVIVLEIDRVLVDVLQQLMRDLGEARLGVAHRRRRIAVDRAEVALPVDQRHAHRPVLRHAHQRVVDRGVAVRMVFTHHVADRRAPTSHVCGSSGSRSHACVEDAAVHRLQAVAHVRQRAADDHAHRVIEVGTLHLLDDGDRLNAVGAVRPERWFLVGQIESQSKLGITHSYIGTDRFSNYGTFFRPSRELSNTNLSHISIRYRRCRKAATVVPEACEVASKAGKNAYSAVFTTLSRVSPGAIGARRLPITRRKRRLKVDRSLKPASKAIVERARPRAQPYRGAVQPRPQQELIGRHAGERRNPAGNDRGWSRPRSAISPGDRAVGFGFDQPDCFGDALLSASSGPSAKTRRHRLGGRPAMRSRFPRMHASPAVARGFRIGQQRRQPHAAAVWRRKSEPPGARHRRPACLHDCRGKMEREAAVADAMSWPHSKQAPELPSRIAPGAIIAMP